MKNMDYEINRLSGLAYGTIVELRKYRDMIKKQLEIVSPEYYDTLEKVNPHRVAIDDALIPYEQINDLLEEVSDLKIFPEKHKYSWTEICAKDEYIVLKSTVEDGVNADIEDTQIYKFNDKLKAVNFCMDESRKEVEKCYKSSHEYKMRVEGDSFFVYESDTRIETIFTIKVADKIHD